MRLLFNISFRNFLRTPILNILNILGLSIGLLAALLILVYVDHQSHYDHFHEQASSIYRMEARTNGQQWFSNLGMEHARELDSGNYPEVIEQVMVNNARKAFFKFQDTRMVIDPPQSGQNQPWLSLLWGVWF